MFTEDKLDYFAALLTGLTLAVNWLAYKANQSQFTCSLKRDHTARTYYVQNFMPILFGSG